VIEQPVILEHLYVSARTLCTRKKLVPVGVEQYPEVPRVVCPGCELIELTRLKGAEPPFMYRVQEGCGVLLLILGILFVIYLFWPLGVSSHGPSSLQPSVAMAFTTLVVVG
jgi:hypothetical protein